MAQQRLRKDPGPRTVNLAYAPIYKSIVARQPQPSPSLALERENGEQQINTPVIPRLLAFHGAFVPGPAAAHSHPDTQRRPEPQFIQSFRHATLTSR